MHAIAVLISTCLWLFVLGGFFYSAIISMDLSAVYTYLLHLVLVFPFWLMSTACHEAGHAVFAKILKIEVSTITIGGGRPIWEFNIQNIVVQVGWHPFGGKVALNVNQKELTVGKNVLVHVGGIMPSVIFVLVMLLLGKTFNIRDFYGAAGFDVCQPTQY